MEPFKDIIEGGGDFVASFRVNNNSVDLSLCLALDHVLIQ